MQYHAPVWLPSGHLQTIYPAKCVRKPPVQYRRERWLTPDQDFIDIDFVDPPNLDPQSTTPFVVMFHGLEGSSDSHYARAMMHALAARGWAGAIPHFRGCSGELNQQPRFYHSGDAPEVDWILRRLRSRYHGKFYATGVSLGANALLRWLGESQHSAEFVDAACAISAPLDLAQGGAALSSGFNLVYTRAFLQTLKPKCLKKLQQFPNLFDRDLMLQAKNLYEFDNIVTAPLHGYRNTEDYWQRASGKLVLPDITVPSLVLNARNDPFLPGQYLPQQASKAVHLEYPASGGHVGFATGLPLGRIDWLPKRMLTFLEEY